MTTKHAKAAAIMAHTWGINNFDEALALYEEVESSDESVHDVLKKHPGVGSYNEAGSMNDDDTWWHEVTMTAESIDNAREYFKE